MTSATTHRHLIAEQMRQATIKRRLAQHRRNISVALVKRLCEQAPTAPRTASYDNASPEVQRAIATITSTANEQASTER